MAGRNLFDDAALADFVSDLTARPLTDGALRCRLRFLARQCLDLATLVGRNPGRCAWARQILQTLLSVQFGCWDCLQVQPTLAPEPSGVNVDLEFAPNLGVALAGGCCQHDAGAQDNLLFRAGSLDQLLKFLSCAVCQLHGRWFRTGYHAHLQFHQDCVTLPCRHPRCQLKVEAWSLLCQRVLRPGARLLGAKPGA